MFELSGLAVSLIVVLAVLCFLHWLRSFHWTDFEEFLDDEGGTE